MAALAMAAPSGVTARLYFVEGAQAQRARHIAHGWTAPTKAIHSVSGCTKTTEPGTTTFMKEFSLSNYWILGCKEQRPCIEVITRRAHLKLGEPVISVDMKKELGDFKNERRESRSRTKAR